MNQESATKNPASMVRWMRPSARLALAAGLLSLTGCQTGPRWSGPTKAVWVTRFDYKTPEDVTTIIENCRDAGFNTVIFQVRGNATAFYPSKIEPWAEQFGFESPGFDPLALACSQAHRQGLELHAWVNVMPAWRGTTPPAHADQIYNTHPEWFWYDQQGRRQPLTSFYVSLNPCLPEVRNYITGVFREIVANYDLDGLHMDYIRFPNEPPAIPADSGIDYPRDERTLALYRRATGLAPDDDPESWVRWRTDQVTELVADIHRMIRWTRPRAALTASVGTSTEGSLRHFRDELCWVREGLIDAAFPMDYRPDLERFKEGLAMWLPLRDQVRVVPGLWFDRRLSTEEGIDVVRRQIQTSVETTGNFCVFSYASLFETHQGRDRNPGAPSTRPNRAARTRELRRRELLPLIRSIGQAPNAALISASGSGQAARGNVALAR